jgi:hypothetical protein
MAGERDAVRVEGLAKFRRDLGLIDKGLRTELRLELKAAAEIIAVEAAALTPRRTGRLASSWKAGTSGARGIVRNPQPYANVVNWGGNVPSARSTSARPRRHFQGAHMTEKAMASSGDKVADRIADGIEALAVRHGFHR